MEFKVSERLIILSALPREGDILICKTINRTIDKLGLGDGERERSGAEITENGLVLVDDFVTDIDIEKGSVDLIRETFKKLSDRKKLHIEHLPLYERFVDA